ncbi:hypothetical protein IKG49_01520 [Candidatus Saccharibacteria bacterium]|nr:hypothetical protein [Candidatus Saccharibacteria bacterium]
MKHKIISIILAAFFAFMPAISVAPAFADGDECSPVVCDPEKGYPSSVKAACGCEGSDKNDHLKSSITAILNSIIGISSLVAVIFVIIGGIGYMTSSGDGAKVEKAKKTILYATIGIVVCALAFAIVNWVILVALKAPAE